jgi:hypothetical protein
MGTYFIWILIPLAGIAYAAFSEWLKFKQKAAASTHEFAQSITALTEQVDGLTRRMENVEAIVTSDEWARLQAPPGGRLELPDSGHESDQEEAARLARRLRG